MMYRTLFNPKTNDIHYHSKFSMPAGLILPLCGLEENYPNTYKHLKEKVL